MERLQGLLDACVVLVFLVSKKVRDGQLDQKEPLQRMVDLEEVVRQLHALDLTLGKLYQVIKHAFLIHIEVI